MKKINATFILILAALRTTSWAFEFIQQPGKRLEVLEGSAIRLMYKASAYWEHCTFKVQAGVGFSGKEMCKIEWRRNEWNVTLNSCDPRATFIGDYNQFECGIELSDVTVQEAGLWSCNMEAYQLEDIGHGQEITSDETHLRVVKKKEIATTTSNPTTLTPEGPIQNSAPSQTAMMTLILLTACLHTL